MAIVTGSTAHLPALGSHEREEVGNELQATLLELIDLSLLASSFIGACRSAVPPLHLYLDELIDSWRDLATRSPSGSRRRLLADGQAGTVASAVRWRRSSAGRSRIVCSCASSSRAWRGRRAHEGAHERLAELDSASEDVLVGVVRALEEQLWMVRAAPV